MGCTSNEQESSSTIDQTQRTTFARRSPQEQSILNALSGLGASQQQAIMERLQSLSSGESPFALSPTDQAMVNQAYGSAEQQLALQNKDYADFLSGGRGLRMSDSPIASQALQRQALGLSDLLSQKANTSLNLGLQGNQYRNSAALGLSSALPSGSVAAFNPMFQERLEGGTRHLTGTSFGRNTNTPSLMSSIGQGIGLAGQLSALGMGFMAPGVGGLAGGAGGAAAAGGGGYGGIMNGKAGQFGAMFG